MPLKVNYPNHASGCYNKITAAYNEVIEFRDVQQDPAVNEALARCESLLREARQVVVDIQKNSETK